MALVEPQPQLQGGSQSSSEGRWALGSPPRSPLAAATAGAGGPLERRHLAACSPPFLEAHPPDAELVWRGVAFPVHSVLVSHASSVLGELLALEPPSPPPPGAAPPRHDLDAYALPPGLAGGAVPAEHFGAFLALVYAPDAAPPAALPAVDAVLALADFFGAPRAAARCDAWLADAGRALLAAHRADPAAAPAADALAALFAVAARRAAPRAAALLLPWAVSALSGGARVPRYAVWADTEARLGRLRAALDGAHAPALLKAAILDQLWAARSLAGPCAACGCRAECLAAPPDGREWAWTREAERHYLHVLRDAGWARAPPPPPPPPPAAPAEPAA